MERDGAVVTCDGRLLSIPTCVKNIRERQRQRGGQTDDILWHNRAFVVASCGKKKLSTQQYAMSYALPGVEVGCME